jgi:molecular chaperone DnaK
MRKDLIEARNNADNTAYTAEKAVRDFGDKVPAEIRSDIEAKVAEVRKAAQGDDLAAIKSTTEALGQAIQKIGAAVYQEPQAGEPAAEPDGGASPGPGASSSDDGDVIDGEVKE